MVAQTFIAISLGIIPSLVWLFFYLQEDAHPEPKTILLQVFFLGMAAAPLARELELGYLKILGMWSFVSLPALLIGVSVIEELLKFLVVRIRVLSDSDFDEPIDAMIYMVVSALGFAALENILYLLDPSLLGETASFAQGLSTAFARFVSATLFHALASGIVGFWIAKTIFAKKHHWSLTLLGLGMAVSLHTFYNLFMIKQEILIVGIILVIMAVCVAKAFDSLRKQKIKIASNLGNY